MVKLSPFDGLRSIRSNGWHWTMVTKSTVSIGLIIASMLLATRVPAQVSGYGRSSAPVLGGTDYTPKAANPFPPLQGTFAEAHKTLDGKPCISVYPSARAQVINPKIVDQLVIVNNVCGQPIKVQVCYANSSDCIVVPLTGYQKLERVLGIASGSTAFRYEYRELF